MGYKYRFTVFTPAYNRAYIIEKLYMSLKAQSYRDFEWLVVDDGSTDNTKELFNRFLQENDFPINYVCIPNGGKHRAINVGVQQAKGELFFIVDSDDYIVDDALEILDKIEHSIPKLGTSKYSGIRALRGYSKTDVIGTRFPGGRITDMTQLEEARFGVTGDKCEAFYTDIMKQYPFPEFDGEKFLTECVVWDKMAADGYKNKCINQIIYICNYLSDGLTAGKTNHQKESPKGTGLYIYQSIKYKKITGWERRYTVRNYCQQHRDKNTLGEIAAYLHTSKYLLWVYLKYIDIMIVIRQKRKGIMRRIGLNSSK